LCEKWDTPTIEDNRLSDRRRLEDWMADESGYDEKVWDTLKRTIEGVSHLITHTVPQGLLRTARQFIAGV